MTTNPLQALFDKMDRDGSGFIDARDYKRSLRGYATNADIRTRLLNMDEDFDGKVSFEEFSRFMSEAVEEEVPEAPDPSFRREDGSWDWFAIFVHFDADGSGCLEVSELHAFFEQSDPQGSRSDFIALFERLDTNKDMRISYQELIFHLGDPAPKPRLNQHA